MSEYQKSIEAKRQSQNWAHSVQEESGNDIEIYSKQSSVAHETAIADVAKYFEVDCGNYKLSEELLAKLHDYYHEWRSKNASQVWFSSLDK